MIPEKISSRSSSLRTDDRRSWRVAQLRIAGQLDDRHQSADVERPRQAIDISRFDAHQIRHPVTELVAG